MTADTILEPPAISKGELSEAVIEHNAVCAPDTVSKHVQSRSYNQLKLLDVKQPGLDVEVVGAGLALALELDDGLATKILLRHITASPRHTKELLRPEVILSIPPKSKEAIHIVWDALKSEHLEARAIDTLRSAVLQDDNADMVAILGWVVQREGDASEEALESLLFAAINMGRARAVRELVTMGYPRTDSDRMNEYSYALTSVLPTAEVPLVLSMALAPVEQLGDVTQHFLTACRYQCAAVVKRLLAFDPHYAAPHAIDDLSGENFLMACCRNDIDAVAVLELVLTACSIPGELWHARNDNGQSVYDIALLHPDDRVLMLVLAHVFPSPFLIPGHACEAPFLTKLGKGDTSATSFATGAATAGSHQQNSDHKAIKEETVRAIAYALETERSIGEAYERDNMMVAMSEFLRDLDVSISQQNLDSIQAAVERRIGALQFREHTVLLEHNERWHEIEARRTADTPIVTDVDRFEESSLPREGLKEMQRLVASHGTHHALTMTVVHNTRLQQDIKDMVGLFLGPGVLCMRVCRESSKREWSLKALHPTLGIGTLIFVRRLVSDDLVLVTNGTIFATSRTVHTGFYNSAVLSQLLYQPVNTEETLSFALMTGDIRLFDFITANDIVERNTGMRSGEKHVHRALFSAMAYDFRQMIMPTAEWLHNNDGDILKCIVLKRDARLFRLFMKCCSCDINRSRCGTVRKFPAACTVFGRQLCIVSYAIAMNDLSFFNHVMEYRPDITGNMLAADDSTVRRRMSGIPPTPLMVAIVSKRVRFVERLFHEGAQVDDRALGLAAQPSVPSDIQALVNGAPKPGEAKRISQGSEEGM